MEHKIWKGHISFGLINIPVDVVSAESQEKKKGLDFEMIDRHDHAHIGYQKYNKNTGKLVEGSDIVKALKLSSGKHMIFEKEELDALKLKGTNTIEIQQFVDTTEIDPIYFEKPYYLIPAKGGNKPYILLREALQKTGKFALGLIIMHSRQHLVLIGASGPALMLEVIRYAEELKVPSQLDTSLSDLKASKVSPKEIAMAEKLVAELSAKWNPKEFEDTYFKDVMAAVKRKSKDKVTSGKKSKEVQERPSNVLELMPLLEKSLKMKKKPTAAHAARKQARG